jgi:uncharacterized protein (DUF1330 family)
LVRQRVLTFHLDYIFGARAHEHMSLGLLIYAGPSRCDNLLGVSLANTFPVRGVFHMPKAYMVFSYHSVPDPTKLAAYGKLAIPACAPFGARMLARGNAAAAYEHGLKERVTILEFPSLENALAAHDSPAYQEALKALGDGAVRDVRIVEGLE